MGVTHQVAHLALQQRQRGLGVVLEVHIPHHPVWAAHQVACKGLAQAGAGIVHQAHRVQPLLPQRQHLRGLVAGGVIQLVGQRFGGRAWRAQVAQQQGVVLYRQHGGHPQAAGVQRSQAAGFGADGDAAAGVGHRAQGFKPHQAGHGTQQGGAPGPQTRPRLLQPDLLGRLAAVAANQHIGGQGV